MVSIGGAVSHAVKLIIESVLISTLSIVAEWITLICSLVVVQVDLNIFVRYNTFIFRQVTVIYSWKKKSFDGLCHCISKSHKKNTFAVSPHLVFIVAINYVGYKEHETLVWVMAARRLCYSCDSQETETCSVRLYISLLICLILKLIFQFILDPNSGVLWL